MGTQDDRSGATLRILDQWQGRWLRVATEEVRLPGGHEVALDIVRHPGAACIVPFLSDDEILLIRQYRHATGGYLLEAPAGKLDRDEAPAACAARELEEETGRHAGRLVHLASIWTTPGFTDERIHLFAAFDLERVGQRLEEHEVIELLPMPFAQALERVLCGEIEDAKTSLALLHAAHRLGRLVRADGPPAGRRPT